MRKREPGEIETLGRKCLDQGSAYCENFKLNNKKMYGAEICLYPIMSWHLSVCLPRPMGIKEGEAFRPARENLFLRLYAPNPAYRPAGHSYPSPSPSLSLSLSLSLSVHILDLATAARSLVRSLGRFTAVFNFPCLGPRRVCVCVCV